MQKGTDTVLEQTLKTGETSVVSEPRAAFPNDPMMPGIPLAVDPTAMQAMFSAELLRVSGAEYRIRECRLLRIRYRPREHCFVHYELDLVSVKTGPCEAVWLTGIIYPDERPRRRLKKLLAACIEEPASEGWHAFGPAFYLPAPHMLVQAFPCDRRLPSLPGIVSGMAAELEAGLVQTLGAGGWKITRQDIQTARYRALSGAVLRFSVEALEERNCQRKTQRSYVKVGRAGEGAREALLLQTLHAQAQATTQAFTFTRPVTYLEELSALIVEEAPGVSFEQAILDGDDIETASRKAAHGLAAFHLWSVQPPAAADAVIARTKVAGQYVSWACPALLGDVQAIADVAAAALARTQLRPAHLDLKPDHMFLDGERIVFIDLDTFGAADPVLDVATMLARLRAMPLRFGALPEHVELAARVFTEEYFAKVPRHWQSRLEINHAVAALQVASEFFRHQHPDWRDLVPAWILRARQAADASSW
ncbi:phosphotransferase [Denitrobaculum tricleocarpae]|uniref:Phosphotransferase n=1 Tax=Denitrobaculum tricleocarpae TaxID=2591009 RepID=A0A545U1G7_9PROT|nr:phosphotransferase [Denitrobaculum tricleocarpae]TQV83321.1 phosphotransferase [Denitrobaculum tricleocarpae]